MSAVLYEILEKRNGPVSRRRELKTELTRLAADISAIDRVVLMLDPGHEARVPPVRRQKQSSMYPRGELTIAALETLRKLGRAAILAARGQTAERDMRAQLVSRVSAVFSRKVEAGQVRRAGNAEGRQLLWEIAA